MSHVAVVLVEVSHGAQSGRQTGCNCPVGAALSGDGLTSQDDLRAAVVQHMPPAEADRDDREGHTMRGMSIWPTGVNVLIALLVLGCGCSQRARPSDRAKRAHLKTLISRLVKPRGTDDIETAISALEEHAAKIGDGWSAASLTRFPRFYRGDRRLSPSEETEARIQIWLAGRAGHTGPIEEYLTRSSPDCVWYTYADARGIRAYYSLTEGALIDQIIGPSELKDVLAQSGLLPRALAKPQD
ncbi:MAG: hypothetical protein ACOC8H_00265 [bacterium]